MDHQPIELALDSAAKEIDRLIRKRTDINDWPGKPIGDICSIFNDLTHIQAITVAGRVAAGLDNYCRGPRAVAEAVMAEVELQNATAKHLAILLDEGKLNQVVQHLSLLSKTVSVTVVALIEEWRSQSGAAIARHCSRIEEVA